MTTEIDCPICFEFIDFTKNCITTECGHCFHANCLMTNISHNGFSCPNCRAEMAETANEEDEDDEDDEEDNTIWSYYDDDDANDEEMFDERALRGLRFFSNILNDEPHDESDIADEEADEKKEQRNNEEINEKIENLPSPSFITKRLAEQGITMEHLVKSILVANHEEYSELNDAELEKNSDEIFGKLRIIISNYSPEKTIISQKLSDNISWFPQM